MNQKSLEVSQVSHAFGITDVLDDINLRLRLDKFALARALVMQPDSFLLDEPFSALDIGLKSELFGLLIEQLIQQDAAVLMITHDLMEADPGRIVQRFPLSRPLAERDNNWVYKTTAELIQKPEVKESFSLA